MAQINKYSRMQILLSGHMDRFANMQNLRISKLRFALDRFAYVSKICVYAKFAYVSKSSHVTGALVKSELCQRC